MKKPTMDDYKTATESMLWTLSLYQQGVNTIIKENPNLSFDQHVQLVNTWWLGIMAMIGTAPPANDNTKGLIM